MRVSVVFTPEAEAQLLSLYRFIAARATPAVAQRYVSGIIAKGSDPGFALKAGLTPIRSPRFEAPA